MKKSKSSARWLAEHESDEYVKMARERGYRSRATFKLLEIDERYKVFRPGMVVVDLGAAPGGWSQVAIEKVGRQGLVIASDILDMDPIEDVAFIKGDFTEQSVLDELLNVIDGRPVDLVISDMAPNLSGMKDIDQPRSMYLVELALDMANEVLKPGGSLITKVFEGEGIDPVRQEYRRKFKDLLNFKPRASRARSREIYLIGRDFKG